MGRHTLKLIFTRAYDSCVSFDLLEMVFPPVLVILSRLLFSRVLPAARRRRLLAAVEAALEEQVETLRADRDRDRAEEPHETWIATTGALDVARARLRWIRWARRQIE